MSQPIFRQATNAKALFAKIEHIVANLPPIEYHERWNGEVDFYGASHRIARALGLEKPLYSAATWIHGWLWRDLSEPGVLVDAERIGVSNLVATKEQEEFLHGHGYKRAVAAGTPFIYANAAPLQRIPGSIIVFPQHVTQCAKYSISGRSLPYVDFVVKLKERFPLVVASIGYEDAVKGNWIEAFEAAGIPWITGAWTYDRNALERMHAVFGQFEFVTTNTPGSHLAYASYCGCKVSYWGKDCGYQKQELDTHPHHLRYGNVTNVLKTMDFTEYCRNRYPFFFTEPEDATTHVDWARQALGEENRKKPEEIAELLGWNIRKAPSGTWYPVNKIDALNNVELFAKAAARSQVGRHEEAFRLTNALKRRHVRMRDVDVIRARYFLSVGNEHGAREALKEELRHFPDNAQASAMLEELGGDVFKPHVATNEADKEFIDLYNTVRPFTRLNIKRARSLYDLAMRVCRENVPGNIVECGVAAGGSTMLLALVVQKHSKMPRRVFAFDTFTGMPDPEDVDTANGVPADETGWGTATCAAPEEFVRAQCERLGVGGIVATRKGLFEATLPVHREEIGRIAMLHMDADWYSSTMTILDNLFEQLDGRALIQIDDWGAWDGCKKAIMDFSVRHDLFFDVKDIDGTGVWCEMPVRTGKQAPGQGVKTPPPGDPFLDPKLSPEFADLYVVRTRILERLNQAIPLFRGTLLDVGCGQMPYREHILGRNGKITRYVGLDFATGKYADRKQPDITWDGTVIPLADASVDCAMATEVLEHCPDPLAVLKEIRRVLAPGGAFFFTTPYLWPIHDAPHDHYRYTPYAMERLLAEAGFKDAHVGALGGWNASLAQMIGLWLRRAPMAAEMREGLTRDLFPFYQELLRTDAVPDDFSRNPMITGLAGTAVAPANSAVKATSASGASVLSNEPGPRVIIVTDQFPVLSQTFILDQITGLMDRGLGVEHWSLQRMDEPVVHDNVRRYHLLEKTRYITLPPDSLRGDPHKWTERFLRDNGLVPPDDAAAIQIHFGPNFRKLEPLFSVYPGLRVAVSFHGYDGSATFRVKGADVYAGLFARADLITTPSQFMKDTLVQYGCPEAKVVVHHYGKDTTAFAPVPREDGRARVRVLSVARFVEKKGLEYSLAAFARAQAGLDAEYRIVGYGPLEPELRALVASLGVAEKVVFLGQLPNEGVRREMAEADIFALTSVTAANGDQEGVPVSLIEAQALGLPVVSSWHSGIPELVAHGETGFLAEERNVDEISGYLRVLLKNPAIRKTFAVNARQRVLREFDLSILNDALADHLRGQAPARTGNGRAAQAPIRDAGTETSEDTHPGPATALAGEGVNRCPICGGNAAFRAFGTPPRPAALCPGCTSLERHRSLWLFLKRYTDFFASSGLRMLHFAPEVCLEQHFRKLLGAGYVTADLLDPRADVRADITALQFADASFDVVYCSHVLEHVPDDRKAMRELHRVLKRDGVAIVVVPLRGATTDEDLSITDPDERTRRYGQSDHVRYYGMDIMDRLRDAGFDVTHVDTGQLFSQEETERMRLGGGQLFLCRRAASPETVDTGSGSRARKSARAARGTAGAASGGATEQALRATARYWSTPRGAHRTRWWMHPAILRHCNGLVCGAPLDGPWAGLEVRMRELAGGHPLARGVSVGCGSASKELGLLERGIVGSFDLYEISAERVAIGMEAARQQGVADRVRFHARDAFTPVPGEQGEPYDLVYWNNALHHMHDVRQALAWSRDRLRPGGLLVVDDYVGATRFQWPDVQLDIASRVRRALPERLRRDPERPDRLLPDRITRPDLAEMIAVDPSEAADSGSIIPALREMFPGVHVIATGGVVYNLALKDAIANFDDTRDAALLQDLLEFDARLAAEGHTQYACAFAFKQAA